VHVEAALPIGQRPLFLATIPAKSRPRWWRRPIRCQGSSVVLVDGAPAARFTERFKELIERGYGLIEQESPALNECRPQPQVV
jgi:hypothetical protein